MIEDKCKTDSTKCQMNEYAELSWSKWESRSGDWDDGKDAFNEKWAEEVEKNLGIPKADVLAVYDRANDKYDTEDKQRSTWKYGAAMGVSGTPAVAVNGVKLDSFPANATEWQSFFKQLYPEEELVLRQNMPTQMEEKDLILDEGIGPQLDVEEGTNFVL